MKIIQFADSTGRPGHVRADAILAIICSDGYVTNTSHPAGGYCPAILLLQGGHRIETNTNYNDIMKTWSGHVWGTTTNV